MQEAQKEREERFSKRTDEYLSGNSSGEDGEYHLSMEVPGCQGTEQPAVEKADQKSSEWIMLATNVM